MTRDDYIWKLLKSGYQLVGSGVYSMVYAKPRSKHVIKVGGNASDRIDGAWFYLNAIKGRKEKCFPVIHWIRKYDGWYAVKMERLIGLMELNNAFSGRIIKDFWKFEDNSADDQFLYCRRDLKPADRVVAEIINSQPLIKRGEFGLSYDVKISNLMVRKIGRRHQLVVTDPIA